MDKAAVKDLIYGGLEELINNGKYFYSSSISRDYCRFTDEGERTVLEFMTIMAWQIHRSEQEDLEQRARQQVIDTLSKN